MRLNRERISDLSAELIIKYYENDPMPFLEHMDDDALWYGPATGQFLRGRENMIQVWAEEDHTLTFSIGDIKVEAVSSHPSFCEVMLLYTVVTHYPKGHDTSVNQRLHLSWGERTVTDQQGHKVKEPKILLCHTSNPHGKHEDDVIYPKSYGQEYAGRDVMPQKGERTHFRAADKTDYFFLSDSIYWIETTHNSKHSILHTTKGDFEVLSGISSIARDYHHLFLRCHRSFLINPNYIRSIRRFQLTLTDDTVVPIAEKKYIAFRNAVIKHQNR